MTDNNRQGRVFQVTKGQSCIAVTAIVASIWATSSPVYRASPQFSVIFRTIRNQRRQTMMNLPDTIFGVSGRNRCPLSALEFLCHVYKSKKHHAFQSSPKARRFNFCKFWKSSRTFWTTIGFCPNVRPLDAGLVRTCHKCPAVIM
jgi:hypothetical protein